MMKHDLVHATWHVTAAGNETDAYERGHSVPPMRLVLDIEHHDDGTLTAVLSEPIPRHGPRSSTAREKAIAKAIAAYEARKVAMPKTGLVKRARVARSPIAGWGLFATCRVAAGETVDESPLLLARDPLPPLLDGHAYDLGDGQRGFPCGDGIFVNDATPPNAEAQLDHRRLVMRLVALRAIEPGDEITIDYDAFVA